MEFVLAALSLFYITYRFGKEDGKWGCFSILVVILIVGMISVAINK